MARSRFIVGIDLGTTHTVVAYAEGDGPAAIFPIAQLVSPTEVEARPLLPSALYAPVAGELVNDPWEEAPFVVGEFARARGSEVPGRAVSSAKSWLSHAAVDREAPILPWGSAREGDEAAPLISPVAASALYLRHVRSTWDAAYPSEPLAEQDVVLTVPASFDPTARELTVAAARRAGLTVSLLEEPQAAFYDQLQRATGRALEALVEARAGEALVLVCDVGGGTTDLSLMQLRNAADERGATALAAARIAVGRHLLLGGDNMDLALAHLCETRLGGDRLSPGELAQLTAACRAAKEILLREGADERAPVTLLSSGSQLLGRARGTELTTGDVERVLVEGFLPHVSRDPSAPRARAGLTGLGLPFERDVAITGHIAAFLQRHAPGGRAPAALLLNGGVFRAPKLAVRLRAVVQSWSDTEVALLLPDAPDLAVALGAVVYGQSLRGRGTRIEAPSTRGYYIGVDAPPGERRRLVSILPRGAPEDETHRMEGRTFALTVGRPARFDLFTADEGPIDPTGRVVELDAERFTMLPPVAVRFDATTRAAAAGGSAASASATRATGAGAETLVELEGKLSQVGTLELACVEIGGQRRRFQLAFELRERQGSSTSVPPRLPSAAPRAPDGKRMAAATAAIDEAFGKPLGEPTPRAVKDLVRELERILGERASWSTEVTRGLFDHLLREPSARRRSADHERVFWMLAGYTVRPGFGYPGDDARIGRIAPLFADTLTHAAEPRTWQQFWIAWRRIAPGLDAPEQSSMRDLVDPFLAPAELGLKKRKGLRPLALDELNEMASYLERAPSSRRAELGSWLLDRTYTDKDHRLFAAIGRVGARLPAYASTHHVVSPAIVERWVDHLLREKWDAHPAAADATLQLCRVTGDRARDLPEPLRATVAKRLTRAGVDGVRVRTVRELVELTDNESAARFGESLPVGLRLLG